jgi:hypothetical protein
VSLLLFGLVDADHLMVGGHGPVNPNDIALQANIHQVHINIHSVILDHWCLSLGLGAVLSNVNIQQLQVTIIVIILLLLGPAPIHIVEILEVLSTSLSLREVILAI